MEPRQPLPRLWMMTDERQRSGLFDALERLPPGSGIVFRHYSLVEAERWGLFEEVSAAARRGGHVLMLAGSPARALEWGADGSHGWHEGRAPGLLRSASVHDEEQMEAANAARLDFVFVSPVFATRSHPGREALGIQGFATLAALARMPAIALGGMNAERAEALAGLGIHGWGGIDAWS